MLKRQNSRSSKHQVHSAWTHIMVSSVHNGGRNKFRNAFPALAGTLYMFLEKMNIFFSFYIIIKTLLTNNIA